MGIELTKWILLKCFRPRLQRQIEGADLRHHISDEAGRFGSFCACFDFCLDFEDRGISIFGSINLAATQDSAWCQEKQPLNHSKAIYFNWINPGMAIQNWQPYSDIWTAIDESPMTTETNWSSCFGYLPRFSSNHYFMFAPPNTNNRGSSETWQILRRHLANSSTESTDTCRLRDLDHSSKSAAAPQNCKWHHVPSDRGFSAPLSASVPDQSKWRLHPMRRLWSSWNEWDRRSVSHFDMLVLDSAWMWQPVQGMHRW